MRLPTISPSRLITTYEPMKRNTTKSVWPILLVVVALFVLSVLAPGEWRTVAITPVSRTTPHDAARSGVPIDPKGNSTPNGLSTSVTDLPTRDDGRHRVHAKLPEGIELLSPTDVQSLVSAGTEGFSSVGGKQIVTTALDRFAMPKRVVEIGPAVTRQFVPPTVTSDPPSATLGFEPDLFAQPPKSEIRLAYEELPPRSDNSARNVARSELEPTLDATTHWPSPTELAGRVEALTSRDDCVAWCENVLEQCHHLAAIETLDSTEIPSVLRSLRHLAKEGIDRANATDDLDLRSDLGRTAHAIERRLMIWSQVHAITSRQTSAVSMTVSDSDHSRQVVESLEAQLSRVEYGGRWREYLLLDEAKQWLCDGGTNGTVQCCDMAKRILLRMEYTRLTPSQLEFLEQPEVADYAAELRRLAAEPVDYLLLLDALERYEKDGRSEHATHVAAAQQMLRWADADSVSELGYALNAHYRNANIRIAIREDLLGRFLPATESRDDEVDDVILGTPTFGRSETMTGIRVKLLPSSRSWRFALEAQGEVNSQTYSRRGPATFYASGESEFHAEKRIVVHPYGVSQHSAHAVAENSTTLTDIETRLDPLPIVGEVSRAIARRRYRNRVPAARWEVENKIAWKASAALDEEVAEQLDRTRRDFATHFSQPMRRLALDPIALEMQTTENEAIVRVRLAACHQLAAHTPRPTSPEGSWLSVQIHESALNNCIEQFGWEGRRVKLGELYGEIGELFASTDVKPPEDLPDNVTVRFAGQDPLRISFHEGRATLTLALSELSDGRNRWKNFVVRAHYRPAPEQPDADLVRDSYVQLIGRLGFRDQVALRGIFSRVFSRTKPIRFVSKRLNSDPRLKGLVLTQLAIGDGWIGIAIAPPPSVSLAGT